MPKLMGALLRPNCPACRRASGPDCSGGSRGKGGQRAYEKRFWRRDQDAYETLKEERTMSGLSEKLHEFITKIRGGADVAHHDVQDVVQTVTEHLSATLIPAVEERVKSLLASIDADIKAAVSDARAFERAEGQKIVEELSATYQKLAETHGPQVADQALADAHAAAQAVVETPGA